MTLLLKGGRIVDPSRKMDSKADMLIEKGNIAPDMLDFLLGRPLAETIPLQFGIKIKQALPD